MKETDVNDAGFTLYDEGFRVGTFDKCNGRPFALMRNEQDLFACGYWDAYDTNTVQIEPEPTGSTFDTPVENEQTETVYRLWIEGDWGQEGLVFGSEHAARYWADDTFANWENQDECWDSYQQAADEGMAGIEPLTVIY